MIATGSISLTRCTRPCSAASERPLDSAFQCSWRAWCNGCTRAFQALSTGSIPVARFTPPAGLRLAGPAFDARRSADRSTRGPNARAHERREPRSHAARVHVLQSNTQPGGRWTRPPRKNDLMAGINLKIGPTKGGPPRFRGEAHGRRCTAHAAARASSADGRRRRRSPRGASAWRWRSSAAGVAWPPD